MAFELCLNTSTIKPQPMLEKIRLTAEAGFQGIELWVNDIYEYVGRGGEVRDIEKALGDFGLFVPCMISARAWGEASEAEYPIMRDEVRRRLEMAARLKSPWLVCSPPRQPCELQQIIDRYRDLLDLGREIGVRPTFEYISFFGSVSRLDQAWHVVRETGDDHATLIADAFHTWNSQSDPELLGRIPGHRISHYHINDADPNIPAGQQVDAHRVMVGDGPIDLRREIELLREQGFQGAVSLELFNPTLWAQDPLDVLKTGFERMTALLAS